MVADDLSWHRFVSNDVTLRKISARFTSQEEEMIAMLRPGAGTMNNPRVKLQPSPGITDEDKAEARARILDGLAAHKGATGTWEDIREMLELTDIRLSLFKKSCWHLKKGDRDPEGKARINVRRVIEQDRSSSHTSAMFIITVL